MGESEIHAAFNEIKRLFQEWHVRGAIILSLLLQVLLLFLTTYRKRTSNPLVQAFVTGVYKSSSWVANAAFAFTVGAHWFAPARYPFGFWGAFALLHLAGPESLTAYSLEDCDAWLSFFLKCVWQYFFHFFICALKGENLRLLTAIVFFVALFRFLGRTLRLRFGLLEMNGRINLPEVSYPCTVLDGHDPLLLSSNTAGVWHSVHDAHLLLRASLRLIAGFKHGRGRSNPNHYRSIQKQFKYINPKQTMRILEVELNFIYDSFHTDGIVLKHLENKHFLLYASLSSYAPICSIFTMIYFIISHKGGNYVGIDYNVTCILLWGTVILEFLSFLRMVFSDWTIAPSREHGELILHFAPHKRRWWADHDADGALAWVSYGARVMFRRWSETISKFNLLTYSITRPIQLADLAYTSQLGELLGISSALRSLKPAPSEWYTDTLGIFIANGLRGRNPSDLISSLRDEWGRDDSFKTVMLQWHVATEVLYNCHDSNPTECQLRQYSKLLSDYMAYLLFRKPRLISRLKGNPLAEVERVCASIKEMASDRDYEDGLQEVCQKVVSFQASDKLYNWTPVFNLIQEVTDAAEGTETRYTNWTVVSEKWVKLLLYAASEIEPLEHVKGLCQGGELLSLIWLLAFHMGYF